MAQSGSKGRSGPGARRSPGDEEMSERPVEPAEAVLLPRNVVVVGGSAGAIEATTSLMSRLPSDLPATLFVVIHRSFGESVLPQMLAQAGPLPVQFAEDGAPLESGRVY